MFTDYGDYENVVFLFKMHPRSPVHSARSSQNGVMLSPEAGECCPGLPETRSGEFGSVRAWLGEGGENRNRLTASRRNLSRKDGCMMERIRRVGH